MLPHALLILALLGGPAAVLAQHGEGARLGNDAVGNAAEVERRRAPAQPLDVLVADALANNLALQQRTFDLEASRHALTAARHRFLPALSVEARFTRAGGGRTIDLPLGDLFNPVYGTLNDLLAAQGEPAAFSTLENEEFRFYRDQEQATRLRIIQPVYQPRLNAAVRAQRYLVASKEAEVETYRRELVRDVKVAYFGYLQAERAFAVYVAAALLVAENLRTTERLLQADKVLSDAVLRARAEALTVAQQVTEARGDRDLARGYVNFLLNRPLDTPLEEPAVDEPPFEAAPLADAGARTALVLASDEEVPAADSTYLAVLQVTALEQRFELDGLDAALRAQEAAVDLQRADYLPSVAVALEGGIQGTSYGFGGDRPFYLASAVLSWTLFGGGAERAEVRQAEAELARVRTQRDEAALRIRLQVQEAFDAVRVARASQATAAERLAAAREGFRLTQRLVAEGRTGQVAFVDARTTLTSAALNLDVTRYALLARLAELEYAVGVATALLD
jgi:outer membrane protein